MSTQPPTPLWSPTGPDLLIHGDNLAAMARLPDASMQLIYLDPPFNTGRAQRRATTRSTRDPAGTHLGFAGTNYSRTIEALSSYDDVFADYWAFLAPRLIEAHRLLRDEGAAHEVVQDAFLDLWRTAPDYDADRASVTTWLVRLVRLRAIDRLRRDGAERRGAGQSATQLDAAADIADTTDVAALVEGEDDAVRVRGALAELPLDQRRVVELAFLEGHTHAELAELLGLPLGTIKTRCFRGLARLAELLADERAGGAR